MIPAWFVDRKYNYFIGLLIPYTLFNYMVYTFVNSVFLLFFISTTFMLATTLVLSKKGFKKRKEGIAVENMAAQWLREQLSSKGILVRTSVQMKYGDIDIHIPSLKTVIDVKSFRMIDKRIYEPKILKSIHRQQKYVNADLAIIWLPYAKIREIVHVSNNVYAVSGKNKIFELLKITRT